MRALVFVSIAACSAHRPPPPPPPAPVHAGVDYMRVAPNKLYRDRAEPLDGKRISLTAFVPPPEDPMAKTYPGSLFWEWVPLVHTAGNVPPPGEGYELVTVYGTYDKGEITIDRWERVVLPLRSVTSNELIVTNEPEHVVVEGRYEHREGSSAIDGTIWVTGCPTFLPDGAVRVEGWLFGKRGTYGRMNRYASLLLANRCEAR